MQKQLLYAYYIYYFEICRSCSQILAVHMNTHMYVATCSRGKYLHLCHEFYDKTQYFLFISFFLFFFFVLRLVDFYSFLYMAITIMQTYICTYVYPLVSCNVQYVNICETQKELYIIVCEWVSVSVSYFLLNYHLIYCKYFSYFPFYGGNHVQVSVEYVYTVYTCVSVSFLYV